MFNEPFKEKILIYRLGSLGDTVMALPCFHKIRETFPEAEITLLTNRPVVSKAAPLEAVLGTHYFFDRVIDYPVATRNIILLLRLLIQIRRFKIGTLINLTAARSRKSAIRDRIFFILAGVRHLIGFPVITEDFEVCIDPSTGLQEFEAKRLARRINALGPVFLKKDNYWDLLLTKDEIYKANEVLLPLSKGQNNISISLGTKNQANDWGLSNWVKLLKRLSIILPSYQLIIIGAAIESEFAHICLEAWNKQGLNLCGKINPRVSAAVLKQSKIFIGHDSGPIHLASCVGIPCVGIYSARNLPGQWFPKGRFNKILYNLPECAGCKLEVCITQNKKCILSISVEDVEQAVINTLNELGQ